MSLRVHEMENTVFSIGYGAPPCFDVFCQISLVIFSDKRQVPGGQDFPQESGFVLPFEHFLRPGQGALGVHPAPTTAIGLSLSLSFPPVTIQNQSLIWLPVYHQNMCSADQPMYVRTYLHSTQSLIPVFCQVSKHKDWCGKLPRSVRMRLISTDACSRYTNWGECHYKTVTWLIS